MLTTNDGLLPDWTLESVAQNTPLSGGGGTPGTNPPTRRRTQSAAGATADRADHPRQRLSPESRQ